MALRNESKNPEPTPSWGLRYAIIVAGPSGAGKNAFIERLVSGEMQADVLAALQLRPREAMLIAELDHALWMPQVLEMPEGRTPVMHYARGSAAEFQRALGEGRTMRASLLARAIASTL